MNNKELYYRCYKRINDGKCVYLADFVKFADGIKDPFVYRVYKMIWNKNYCNYWVNITSKLIESLVYNRPMILRREVTDFLRLVEYNEDRLEDAEIEYYADKMIEYAKKIVEEEKC